MFNNANERNNQSFRHSLNPSSVPYRVCNIGHAIWKTETQECYL